MVAWMSRRQHAEFRMFRIFAQAQLLHGWTPGTWLDDAIRPPDAPRSLDAVGVEALLTERQRAVSQCFDVSSIPPCSAGEMLLPGRAAAVRRQPQQRSGPEPDPAPTRTVVPHIREPPLRRWIRLRTSHCGVVALANYCRAVCLQPTRPGQPRRRDRWRIAYASAGG